MNDSKYDVIIVGSGVAGCFCALQLPNDCKVLLITKKKLEDCNSYLAQGGICVLKQQDDKDAFINDTLTAGHFYNDKEIVEIMVNESRDIIHELETYQVEFEKKDNEYLYTKEGAHSTSRILYYKDQTGKEITTKLIKAVTSKSNIDIKEETRLIDLICDNNQCYGIITSNSNKIQSYLGKHIVLATGGVGGLYPHSTNYRHMVGDGLALALKHNILLKDDNYVQFHPTSFYEESNDRRFLLSESLRGEGARLYNHKKERFVEELLPRDKVVKAIYQQMELEKQPYVFLSLKDITDVNIEERFPTIVAYLKQHGYDPLKEMIPVVPAQHYYMGGIKSDRYAKTSMMNLFAIGETACNGVHGKNRLASNSLLESLVFARRAALYIKNNLTIPFYSKDIEISHTIYNQLAFYKEQVIKTITKGE